MYTALCCWDIIISTGKLQYIPRNMHTAFALLCFVVVIHWLIIPYPSGLLHWHCDNLTIAPVPAKQPWWIWINTSCEFGFVTTTTVLSMMCVNDRIYYDPKIVYMCFTLHSLASLWSIVWRHGTYRVMVGYIPASVWLQLCSFAQLSYQQYTLGSVFSSYPFLFWWVSEYLYSTLSSSNWKNQSLAIVEG